MDLLHNIPPQKEILDTRPHSPASLFCRQRVGGGVFVRSGGNRKGDTWLAAFRW
jgi:hypothetical protein